MKRSWYADLINQIMVWNRQLTTGIGNWQISTETVVQQKQEWSLRVRKSRDRGSHLHLSLGWRHHSGINKQDSDLRCQKGTRSNISHGRQRENTLVSGCKNQTRSGQSHSRPKTLHRNNGWAVSNGSMQTPKNSSWFEVETSDSTEWRRRSGPEDLQKLGWITSVSGQTNEARYQVHSQRSVQTHECTYQSTLDVRKKTLRYLQGSKGLKLDYTKEASFDLVGESDADWSGDVNDRKSTVGYYFKLNGRGAAISWGVKKQATVALSSSEAEYQGMAAAVQEVLYLKELQEDLGIQQKRPRAIGEDNQSCIKLCRNPVMHKRSKHIETKFHFIWDKTEDGTVSIHYVPTDKMAADIFTKSLPVSKVETFRTVLMGTDSTQSTQVWAGVLEYRSNFSLKLCEN